MPLNHLTSIQIALVVGDRFLAEIFLDGLGSLFNRDLWVRLRNKLVEVDEFL
jgi:hypothetical protein